MSGSILGLRVAGSEGPLEVKESLGMASGMLVFALWRDALLNPCHTCQSLASLPKSTLDLDAAMQEPRGPLAHPRLSIFTDPAGSPKPPQLQMTRTMTDGAIRRDGPGLLLPVVPGYCCYVYLRALSP